MDVQLRVVQGKPKGLCVHFAKGEFIFGRGPECYIRPNSEWVSRQHCLFKVADAGISLRNLGSSNGTLVNGRLITQEHLLHNGDTLQLGPLVLQLVVGDSPTMIGQLGHSETLHDVPGHAHP